MTDAAQKRAQELISLARGQFAPLREAEEKLLRAAPAGEMAWCGPSKKDFDPANDAKKSDLWGEERAIRAELIRWLCVDHEARECVDQRGIQAHGARIEGELDLSFVTVPFPLLLTCCGLRRETTLRFLEIPTLSLSGCAVKTINAECASVKGSVTLSNGFCAEGEVQLLGAQIGSNLDCGAGTFRNAGGKALRADRLYVQGSVFLRNAFVAEGEVRLLGAEIGGNLECNDGTFRNVGGRALSADRAGVQGSVFLRDGFSAEGAVRLPGAMIGGNLECNQGAFKNPGGVALNADRISTQGNVLLSGGFVAEGEVNLAGAQIGNNLSCDGGVFKNGSGRALNADGTNVKGFAFFRGGFRAEGEVNLLSAQIGDNLECDGGSFKNAAGRALNADRMNVQGNAMFRSGFSAEGEVRLVNAVVKGTLVWTGVNNPGVVTLILRNGSAGAIQDDKASWPSAGKLDLDGFVYGHIATGLTDTKNRLAWLTLQQPFTPQPYRQLAKVMNGAGFDRGERRVLFAMEDRIWREEGGVAATLFRLPLSLVVGYGYYPMRALMGLAILMVLGWGVYSAAHAAGMMVPKDAQAYAYFKQNGRAPASYEPLGPFVFSVENSLPLVKLGQTDNWRPDPSPDRAGQANWITSSRFLFGFLRLQILLGWILTTLFIAGVTGIVQKD
jgi:hypothetical protein